MPDAEALIEAVFQDASHPAAARMEAALCLADAKWPEHPAPGKRPGAGSSGHILLGDRKPHSISRSRSGHLLDPSDLRVAGWGLEWYGMPGLAWGGAG